MYKYMNNINIYNCLDDDDDDDDDDDGDDDDDDDDDDKCPDHDDYADMSCGGNSNCVRRPSDGVGCWECIPNCVPGLY